MSAIRAFDKFQKLLDVTWSSIADGQLLKRSGTSIIGIAASGTGDVVGPASAVDSEVALFSGTGGKTIKRAAGTGYVTVVNGVYQTPTAADMAGRMPKGHIWGLVLSNNGADAVNDIDISAGEARDSTNAVDMVLGSALTKRLDAAWVVGTNQGGLDTGTVANNTYHVWLIERTDGTVADVLFSLSATAPTMPTNYTYKRRIGSIMRAGATIIPFTQWGDQFLHTTVAFDIISTTLGTTASLFTLRVPTGIKVLAQIWSESIKAAAIPQIYISSPDSTDQDAAGMYSIFSISSGLYGFGQLLVRTNTSAQIRARSQLVSTSMDIVTIGWFDDRGRTF